MTIDENTRLDLRNRLAEVLGPHLANAAMEAMPPLDYSNLATRADLEALGSGLRGETAGLRGEMAELRGEMVRLHGETQASQASQASLMRTIILAQFASVIAVAGFVAGLG